MLEALHTARGQRQPVQGLLHHSDRGSRYASWEYHQLLAHYGSMCRKGNCWDTQWRRAFSPPSSSSWPIAVGGTPELRPAVMS